jgi:hypothetical protein
MDETLPNTTITTDATLPRGSGTGSPLRSRNDRQKIIDRLNEIAALYDELAAEQDPGPTDRE